MSTARAPLWGVIPAAGIGRRIGGAQPKQYRMLAGATVLEHSLAALLDGAGLAAVAVALHPDDTHPDHLACFEDTRVLRTVGGAERADSVLAGLRALAGLAAEDHWVLVHDAARPCVTAGDIEALVSRVLDSGVGGILAEPVVDTVKLSDSGGRVQRTLDRGQLWRAQTPQMFRLGELRAALESALALGLAVTDEASAMELAGHPVQLVTGSRRNLKITLPADLPLAAWYMGHPEGDGW